MTLFKFFLLLIIHFLMIATSQSADSTNNATLNSPVSATTLCKSTPDPSYCKSVLPKNNQSANVYDYARFSFKKSLSQSYKFLKLIDRYLSDSASLSTPALRALQDCRHLAQSNIDYLLTTLPTVNATSQTLSTVKADDIQTYLSAMLTNLQTCSDGVASTSLTWSVRNGIFSPLANDTKLSSMSLALFTKGWVPKIRKKSVRKKGGRPHLPFKSKMKMSKKNRAIFEKVRGRKLLQNNDGGDVVVNDIVTVIQDGSGDFRTITEAIKAAPINSLASDGYFMIYVTTGVYEEYVTVAKNKLYILMVGDGINRTIITGNRNVVDGWTTFNCASFTVEATGFVGVDMTFRNTAGAIKHQAVAVRNSADKSTFYNCSFEAYQDTLYTHTQRQFYTKCDIYGTVDFIFGNAAVIFQGCNIYPRLPMPGQYNAITAQGRTDINQNTGTSILNCTIKPAPDLANSTTVKTYLGRPWKEYSRTVYLQSYMDTFINPAGWKEWNGTQSLTTLYYAEYKNFGPGSNTSSRVKWDGYRILTNVTVATSFTVSSFLLGDDWLSPTGVPYIGGL